MTKFSPICRISGWLTSEIYSRIQAGPMGLLEVEQMAPEESEKICNKIDALVGRSEDESPQERQQRHEMMIRDAEYRKKRRAAGACG